MQVDAQEYLRLVEKNGSLLFWDTESNGLTGDYGSIFTFSGKLFGKRPITLSIGENAQDKGLVREAKDIIEAADAWVTFYGKGHDVPLMNTRLVRWNYAPLKQRPHVDMFFLLAGKLKTARKSQAHMLEFMDETMEAIGIEPAKKMTVSPNVWGGFFSDYHRNSRILRERCESDTEGLESLYRATKSLIRDIKK